MKLLILLILGLGLGFALQGISKPLFVQATSTGIVEADKPPTTAEIVLEIANRFQPEGKAVVKQALNCFYSESGWRPDAVHLNENGTHDGGIAQINDFWGMSLADRFNYKANIAKAYQIYLRSHSFSQWFGSECN